MRSGVGVGETLVERVREGRDRGGGELGICDLGSLGWWNRGEGAISEGGVTCGFGSWVGRMVVSG
jgi:hypothetical protein